MIYQLAQLNVATMREPLTSPVMMDFVDALEHVNSLAEAAPGFVWRLKDDSGDATAIRPFGDNILVNLSVWEDIDTLKEFVYSGEHLELLRNKSAWFEKPQEAHLVLWWVKAGQMPDVTEAARRLVRLRSEGPTPAAFTFAKTFAPGLDH